MKKQTLAEGNPFPKDFDIPYWNERLAIQPVEIRLDDSTHYRFKNHYLDVEPVVAADPRRSK